MRKLVMILFVMMSLFGLAACQKAEPVAVDIISETMTWNTIETHVIVAVELEDMAGLSEIAYSVASQVYESHFNDIGTSRFTLTLYFYTSQTQYEADDADYGYINFKINDTVESPGLSLITDGLIFE